MRAVWSLAILAGIMPAGCARPLVVGGHLTELAYEIDPGGRIVVDVGINDRGPYRFAIDTAATGSFVFARPRDELDLGIVPGVTVTVHGAVATGSFPVVDMVRLTIGQEEWESAGLIALPGDTGATRTLDGVLGADFLGRYTVGIFVTERLVRLYAPGTIVEGSHGGWAEISIEPVAIGQSPEPLRYLEISVAGRSVPALLDLGAGISVLNSPAARRLRLAASQARQAGEFSDAVGAEPILARLGTQRLMTGRVRWRDETFLIADLEIFETLQSTDRPLAILGSGLFRQRDLIIDYAWDRLLVRSSMTELEE